MQNCGKSTFKRTSIDRLMNVLVLCVSHLNMYQEVLKLEHVPACCVYRNVPLGVPQIFGFLALMCTVLAVGNGFWELNEGSQFTVFLPRQECERNNAAFSAFLKFWSYVIILNTVVPISLYVR